MELKRLILGSEDLILSHKKDPGADNEGGDKTEGGQQGSAFILGAGGWSRGTRTN